MPIKLLNGQAEGKRAGARRGGPRRCYGEEERKVLKAIWLAAEQPCGKRLKDALRLWMPHCEKQKGEVALVVRQRLGLSARRQSTGSWHRAV